MSFRLFIYYCALCGAWAALLAWAYGRVAFRAAGDLVDRAAEAGLQGLVLGLFVSFSLGLLDALWNLPLRRWPQIAARVGTAVLVGAVGGLIGGIAGQTLFSWKPLAAFLVFGWAVTGLLIGASVGVFEILAGLLRKEAVKGRLRKIRSGIAGGALGGLLGGLLSVQIHDGWRHFFHDKPPDALWSPSATGFVALGLCIGLLIGMAQVILREAWLRVEAGRRPGREMILSKPVVTIGRAESCDLGLFGDPAVERQHARIVEDGGRYLLADLGTPGGTLLNGTRVGGPTPLRAGDAIQVGGYVLRFRERRKRQR
jgi:hypothetical protein